MFKPLTLDKRYTVYKLPGDWVNDARLESGQQYSRIDESIIQKYFSERSRQAQLSSLLSKGFIGYLLHNG